MSEGNDWAETTSSIATGRVYRSSFEKRLVFFKNARADVLSPGVHRIWPFSEVHKIGRVDMTRKSVHFSVPNDAPTRDNLRTNLAMTITIGVRDQASSIVRVAVNAQNEVEGVRRTALSALRDVMSDIASKDVDRNLNLIGQQARAAMTRDPDYGDLAFDVFQVSIASLDLSNPALRGHSDKLAGTAQRLQELDAARRIVEIQSDLNQVPIRKDAETQRIITQEAHLDDLDIEKKRAELNRIIARGSNFDNLEFAGLRADLMERAYGFAALHPEFHVELERIRALAGADTVKLQWLTQELERVWGFASSVHRFDVNLNPHQAKGDRPGRKKSGERE